MAKKLTRQEPPTPALSEAFGLQAADLRNARTGRWDAERIAEAIGIPLTDLAAALEEHDSRVARTPDSDDCSRSWPRSGT